MISVGALIWAPASRVVWHHEWLTSRRFTNRQHVTANDASDDTGEDTGASSASMMHYVFSASDARQYTFRKGSSSHASTLRSGK